MKSIKVKGIPKRAISDEEKISIDIWLPLELDTDTVKLLFCKNKYWFNTEAIQFDYKGEENGYKVFTKEQFSFCDYETRPEYVHYCCFEIKSNSGYIQWIKQDGNSNPILDEKLNHWVFTVYKNYEIPSWLKGNIMYQIFVDRFFKSEKIKPDNSDLNLKDREYIPWDKEPPKWESENGVFKNNEFYGGNLRGIQEKLPYLRSLNVGVLYLTPILYSKSNHRYDTMDYTLIDPDVGTLEDLQNLCDEAKKYNIHIILDMVFNHTSNEAIYEKSNPDWYLRNERGEYLYWWNFGDLRVLDKDNQEFQRFIFGRNGVIEMYLRCGVDGIRLDVADDLNDYFIAGIRDAMNRQDKETVLYGEVWDNAVKKEKDSRQRKFLLGKWLDSVMNYVLMDAMLRYVRYGNSEYLEKKIKEVLADYPAPAINSLMNIVGTHDTPRILNILAGEFMQESFYETDSVYPHIWDMEVNSPWKYFENGVELFNTYDFRAWEANNDLSETQYELARKRLKILVLIQFFLPGIPCIYYGDEVGMTGYKDPFNRASYPWNKKRDFKLLKFYKKIGEIRHNYADILAEGDLNLISIENDIMIFERVTDEKKILIALNRTNMETRNFRLPIEYCGQKYKILYSINNSSKTILKPYGAIILA